MKNPRLRAFRTLAALRLRRQEALESQRTQEQVTLSNLVAAAREKAEAAIEAQQQVTNQVERIASLLVSGNRFQVADYIGQQDYQAWLEARAASAGAEQAAADQAVSRQQEVLRQAAAAVVRNRERHQRLEQGIRKIHVERDVAQMDADDEEAEEATIVRRQMQATRRVQAEQATPASGSDSQDAGYEPEPASEPEQEQALERGPQNLAGSHA